MNNTGNPYVWPKRDNGTPKSLGEMTQTERVRAEGSIHRARRQMDLTTIVVKSFLERQAAVAQENLLRGVDIG